jgi:hypothetical protein
MWRMAAAIVLLSEVILSGHPQPPARDRPPSPAAANTASVRGRVVAADTREPLRNARVSLAGSSRVPPVFTDDDGRFAFTDLSPGRYAISARKSGYAAVSGALAGMTKTTAATDDLGEYRVGGLHAGTYVVAVSRPQSGPNDPRVYYPGVAARAQAVPITVQAGEERPSTDFTTVALGHPTRLTIRFTDRNGEPASAIAMLVNLTRVFVDAGVPVTPLVGSVVTRPVEPSSSPTWRPANTSSRPPRASRLDGRCSRSPAWTSRTLS